MPSNSACGEVVRVVVVASESVKVAVTVQYNTMQYSIMQSSIVWYCHVHIRNEAQ